MRNYTLTLVLINTVVFFMEVAVPQIFYWFSFVPILSIYQPWRFITSMFLHADFFHLFWNMFALFTFGSYLEAKIGKEKYLLVYFVSGLVGNLLYLLLNFNSPIPAVGASGAIFGVVGCLGILNPNLIVYVGYVPMPMFVAIIIWILVSIFGLFSYSSIAHEAHLGGLLVGLAYGKYIKSKYLVRRKYIRIFY